MNPEFKIRSFMSIRLLFFISALIVGDITAFVLETELAWLNHLLRNSHGPVSFR